MTGASVAPSAGEPRVSMGNRGIDAMLDGGLVGRRPYLVVGPAGTGKTTLALQFLCAGIRNGERCLFVTLEEPPNEVRSNHRGLAVELGKVDVFDAIPDVMRYERAPFKDIAAVRAATPFDRVSDQIRKTPELSSVEVTITALEQMLRTEVQRRAYSRIAIDSLTALQYFCMKGFDPVAGAQTFLRFLSDLRVTTVLTVEAPLEDVETPERMLARGEIRLFRWELDGVTVRAVGVEKFRGSSHDIRLHPYRIGPTGLDINLAVTISRDTREILEPPPLVAPAAPPGPREAAGAWTMELLTDELRDLVLVGGATDSVRLEIEAALLAARRGEGEEAEGHLLRAIALGELLPEGIDTVGAPLTGEAARALARMVERAEAGRAGRPPSGIPEPPILAAQLARILAGLPPAQRATPSRPPPRGEAAVPPAPAEPISPSYQPSAPAGPIASAPARLRPVAEPPAPPAVAWSPAPTIPRSSAPPSETMSGQEPTLSPEPADAAGPPPLPQPAPLHEGGRVSPPPARSPVPRAPRPVRGPIAPPSAPPISPPAPAQTPERVSRPTPPVPGPHEVPAAPASTPTPPSPTTMVGSLPPVGETPAEPTGVRKRRRSTGAPRKKAGSAPTKVPPAPSAPPEVATPVPVAPLEPAAAPPPAGAPSPAPPAGGESPTEPVPAKPKRRAVRKKKAPPVVAATPGPAPEPVTPPNPPAGDAAGNEPKPEQTP